MPTESTDAAGSRPLASTRLDRRRFLARSASIGASLAALGATRGAIAEPVDRRPIRVRVWCEGTAPRSTYPDDVDGILGDDLRRRGGFEVDQGRLGHADAGLSDAALDAADVLVWWGRLRHDDLPDARSRAVVDRVRDGRLGLVALHASCGSKPFRALMAGNSCEFSGWREDGRPERVEVRTPGHPMASGVSGFTIPRTATFAEPFSVPEPDEVVLVSTWGPGETFRSGLTWTIGKGRVAYFRPGHDGFPILFHPSVRRIVANSAAWAAGRA